MQEIEDVRKRLSDRNLVKVSDKSGISYGVLWRFVSGQTPQPRYETIKKLIEYLRENP